MMVRAKKPKIFWPVIPGVAVDVVDVNWDSTRMWITFIPAAHATLFAVCLNQMCLDVSGRLIKTRGRAVNFTGKPSPNVFIVMKSGTTLVRTVDERVSADNIIAAVTPADKDFSPGYSHEVRISSVSATCVAL